MFYIFGKSSLTSYFIGCTGRPTCTCTKTTEDRMKWKSNKNELINKYTHRYLPRTVLASNIERRDMDQEVTDNNIYSVV